MSQREHRDFADRQHAWCVRSAQRQFVSLLLNGGDVSPDEITVESISERQIVEMAVRFSGTGISYEIVGKPVKWWRLLSRGAAVEWLRQHPPMDRPVKQLSFCLEA